jgi:hypothetical protein
MKFGDGVGNNSTKVIQVSSSVNDLRHLSCNFIQRLCIFLVHLVILKTVIQISS